MAEGQSDNKIIGAGNSNKLDVHKGWAALPPLPKKPKPQSQPTNAASELEIEKQKEDEKQARRNARNLLLQARREADLLQKKGPSIKYPSLRFF